MASPFDVQVPKWLEQPNPAEFMLASERAAESIGRNFLSGMQMAQQQSQFKDKLALEVQDQALKGKESAVRMEGQGIQNELNGIKLQEEQEAQTQYGEWMTGYKNRIPTGQEPGQPDPQPKYPPLPTNLVARAKVYGTLQEEALPDLLGMQAEWASQPDGWTSTKSKSEFFDFLSRNPSMATHPATKAAAANFATAEKAKDALALVEKRGTTGGRLPVAQQNANYIAELQARLADPETTLEDAETINLTLTSMKAQTGMKDKSVVEFTEGPNGETIMTFGNTAPRVLKSEPPAGDKAQISTLGKQIVSASTALLRKDATPDEKANATKALNRAQSAFDALTSKYTAAATPSRAQAIGGDFVEMTNPEGRRVRVPKSDEKNARSKGYK